MNKNEDIRTDTNDALKLRMVDGKNMVPTTEGSLFENLITLEELLEVMRHAYSKHTVYRWTQRHGMPHRKIRGRLWFPVPDTFEWLERS